MEPRAVLFVTMLGAPNWRLAEDRTQWLLQEHREMGWETAAYCATKATLQRKIAAMIPEEALPAAMGKISHLTEEYPYRPNASHE